MLRWILALLLIPFLDAVILAVVVSQTPMIGWVGMVLLVVLTGLVGMLLVRAEGRRTIGKIQRSLSQGTAPTNELMDGALLIAAGAFLLTPGLVTDLIGFLLVLPPTRIPIRAAIRRFVVDPYVDRKTGGFASGRVWTFGFPGGDPTGGDGTMGAGDGTTGGGGAAGGVSFGGSSSGDTYDLGDDDYTVETDEDAYTIDFDDGDDADDEPAAR